MPSQIDHTSRHCQFISLDLRSQERKGYGRVWGTGVVGATINIYYAKRIDSNSISEK